MKKCGQSLSSRTPLFENGCLFGFMYPNLHQTILLGPQNLAFSLVFFPPLHTKNHTSPRQHLATSSSRSAAPTTWTPRLCGPPRLMRPKRTRGTRRGSGRRFLQGANGGTLGAGSEKGQLGVCLLFGLFGDFWLACES